MIRSRLFWMAISLVVLIVAFVGGVVAFGFGPLRNYDVQEIVFRERFQRYDALILNAAQRHGVSPSLIKSVIWRESRFQPEMRGTSGERGLMQVTEIAAKDWVVSEKIEGFSAPDLFDPKTNIDVGTWYLARALKHWAHKDNPMPFALAEYNAGRTRVKRWERDSNKLKDAFKADDLRAVMDFPGTRQYIESIMHRYHQYRDRSEFEEREPALAN